LLKYTIIKLYLFILNEKMQVRNFLTILLLYDYFFDL